MEIAISEQEMKDMKQDGEQEIKDMDPVLHRATAERQIYQDCYMYICKYYMEQYNIIRNGEPPQRAALCGTYIGILDVEAHYKLAVKREKDILQSLSWCRYDTLPPIPDDEIKKYVYEHFRDYCDTVKKRVWKIRWYLSPIYCVLRTMCDILEKQYGQALQLLKDQ